MYSFWSCSHCHEKCQLELQGFISPEWPPWFDINILSDLVIKGPSIRFNQNVLASDK
jgi:hypothetical protein